MITIHRNNSIEKTLQKCLDDQNSVWAVGDIHGCNEMVIGDLWHWKNLA